MTLASWMPLICVLIGLSAGGLGSWIGVRIAVTRLEVWRQVDAKSIETIAARVSVHSEDLLVHDLELGQVMQYAGLDRVRRQMVRG